MGKISASFKIDSWDEKPFNEVKGGPKLVHAEVTQTYTEGLEGKGVLEYLMTTYDETFSRFIGIERFEGTVDGRAGSFVLNHKGTFENGVAKSTFSVEPDSGTGALQGIQGKGEFEATHENVKLVFDYTFESQESK